MLLEGIEEIEDKCVYIEVLKMDPMGTYSII